jgi:arylformamidase
MTVIDLSHAIAETMPVYPGGEPPRLVDVGLIARDGFAEKSIRISSHTGTHLDTPRHALQGAAGLDDLEAGRFLGAGLVLDVSKVAGASIEIADLQKYEEELRESEFALLYSGWARHWAEPRYFASFPVLSPAAARWLAEFKLKGVGVDMASVDAPGSKNIPIHKIFFEKNMVIVENLTGLEALVGRDFVFSCLPLKWAGGDGSPVRAVALI